MRPRDIESGHRIRNAGIGYYMKIYYICLYNTFGIFYRTFLPDH